MKFKYIFLIFCGFLLIIACNPMSVYAVASDDCDSFSDMNHAGDMAKKLAKKNIQVEVTEVTPKDFTTGNVVVYISQGKYIRYLKVDNSIHRGDPIILKGYNGEEIKIWTYGYSTQHFIKLTPRLLSGYRVLGEKSS